MVGWLDRSYGERVGQVPAVTKTRQTPGRSPGACPFQGSVVLREQARLDRCFAVEHEVTSLEPGAPQRQAQHLAQLFHEVDVQGLADILGEDRKSTRLNSSHITISYAVF